jgi:hypothetical protein
VFVPKNEIFFSCLGKLASFFYLRSSDGVGKAEGVGVTEGVGVSGVDQVLGLLSADLGSEVLGIANLVDAEGDQKYYF